MSGAHEEKSPVGYASPPVKTRFKKGQSGNPSGRPRKAPSIQALVEARLNAVVTIERKGETSTRTLREHVAEAVVGNMLQGNMRTISWFEELAAKDPEGLLLPNDLMTPGGFDEEENGG